MPKRTRTNDKPKHIFTPRKKTTFRKKKSSNLRPRIKQDRNFIDVPVTNFEASTTGTIALVNTIAQGAGSSQRIGKTCFMRSCQLRGRAVAGSTGTVADGAFIMVYDKRPTGVLPAITDILEGISAQAMNEFDNEGRFRILRRWDKVFAGNTVTPTTGLEIQDMDNFFKINRRLVCKTAGTGAIGDIEEGAIYALSVGNVATGTTAPIFAVAMRFRFTEQ